MQREVPRPITTVDWGARKFTHSQGRNPNLGDEGSRTCYKHRLFSLPFCCPQGKFLCSACNPLASKWCSCFSLRWLTQRSFLTPSPKCRESKSTRNVTIPDGHLSRGVTLLPLHLPPGPSNQKPIFHPQPTVPLRFHSICHHLQIIRAQAFTPHIIS